MERTPVHPAAAAIGERYWRSAAIAMLAVRITQGFIYWGGGSRRFIYAPEKLNPDAHSWMANKFQTAMPGALFGFDQIISYLLLHFDLLYAGLIAFSAADPLRRDADGGFPDASRRAGQHRLLGPADDRLRLAGRDLRR
jgi:TQO small subunit DoxD